MPQRIKKERIKIMKKITKTLAVLLAATLTLSCTAVAGAQNVPGIIAPDDSDYSVMAIDELEEKAVYVKTGADEANNGLTPENPLPTLQAGITALGLEGGTVYIMGDVSLGDKSITWPGKKADGQKRITITGYDDNAVLGWNRALNPNGDITIEYINIRVDKNYAYLNARGNDLILGKGIFVTRAEGVTNDMVVRGGGDTNVNIDGDTNVTVYSGTYSQICGGSRNGIVSGNTNITVYGGYVASINGGNNNGSEPEAVGRNVQGNSYITLLGGEFKDVSGSSGRNIVEGLCTLDVSRYSKFNPNWFKTFGLVKEYDPSLEAETVKLPEIKADGAFIKGYEDNTFRPQNNITRAEAITVISRLLADDAEIAGKYKTEFADVNTSDWYYNTIAYLDNLGALEALTERGNKILPQTPITRIEVCELVAYVGQIKSMKIAEFTDLTAKTNKEAIFALASEGIINGYDNGDGTFSFKPDGTITRAEFVTIIDRFLGRTANENASFTKFTDVSDHWAKNYIIAASSESTADGTVIWTQNKETKSFELPSDAVTSEQYIKALKQQSSTLTVPAIQDGIQMLADKRIEEIRNTKTDIEVKGTAYYVASDGDDTKDGKTPENAWKTLDKVNTASLKADDVVFFKRGDTFRGQLKTKSGVTYSAYGEGNKPNIFGWHKNLADGSLWEETEINGIWKYKEPVREDVGNIIFDDSIHTRKVIRSNEKDGKHLDHRAGREFNTWKDLTENLTFFHDSTSAADSAPEGAVRDTGYVYLRCEEGNPGVLYDSIEMAKKVHVISNGGANNVRIDNLCIAYGGAHGISAGKCDGLTVTNCEFKWIGGSIQTVITGNKYNRTWPTPYGNAVEIYGQATNYTVDNCYIWQAYDAAVTHQGSNSGNLACDNIRYTNNVIEKCVYAVEIFYGESTNKSDKRNMNGTYIENNILRMGGGFGHFQRPDTGVTALIRNGGILNNTTNYIVKNNIFDRSLSKIIQAGNDGGSKAQYFDNIYVQAKNATFCTRLGKTYTADANIASMLASTNTETNPTFIIVGEMGFGK